MSKLKVVNFQDNLSRKDKKAEMKASSAELRKKEKENRRLQQELTTEKDKFNQMVEKYQKDLQDLQVISFIKSRIYFSVPILKNSLITRKKVKVQKWQKSDRRRG